MWELLFSSVVHVRSAQWGNRFLGGWLWMWTGMFMRCLHLILVIDQCRAVIWFMTDAARTLSAPCVCLYKIFAVTFWGVDVHRGRRADKRDRQDHRSQLRLTLNSLRGVTRLFTATCDWTQFASSSPVTLVFVPMSEEKPDPTSRFHHHLLSGSLPVPCPVLPHLNCPLRQDVQRFYNCLRPEHLNWDIYTRFIST